jgi:hypothetical protein
MFSERKNAEPFFGVLTTTNLHPTHAAKSRKENGMNNTKPMNKRGGVKAINMFISDWIL